MTSRGRYSTNEWDLMKEEFNSSTYDPQYPDDDVGGSVQLDHCRLYIRNIPNALNDEGLRTAFSKYGTLLEVFVSKDPMKKYALVRFETPGEAKLAMTKLNNTDPLKLNITIAHKNKYSSASRDDNYSNGPKRSARDDNVSVGSREKSFRRQDDLMNGDEMEDPSLPPVDDDMDPETRMKGIQLQLQRLQVQEQTVLLRQQLLQLEAARKKNLTQSNSTSNRCILPDGRIVVRNIHDRSLESRDVDGSFAAGAGDSRVASTACVACGAAAGSYCARCGLTPYCSPSCQRRDWAERHRAVCHNLAKLSSKSKAIDKNVEETEVVPPPPAPLRRPHSPKRNDDAGSDKGHKKNSPVQSNKPAYNHGPRNYNRPAGDRPKRDRSQGERSQGSGDKPAGNRPKRDRSQGERSQGSGDRPAADRPHGNRPFGDKPQFNKPNGQRPPLRHDDKVDKENWNSKNINKPTTKPAETPKPVQNEAETKPKVNGFKPPGSVRDVIPAKKTVPKNYLIELLSPGDEVLLSVESPGSACRATSGHVCVSVHERYAADYQQLCEQYTVDCDAAAAAAGECQLNPGDTFSYLNPDDGGWYRARLLTPTLAALVDSGKMVKISSSDKLKPLPPKYERPPEFCCLLNAPSIEVGQNFKCTLLSKSADGYKVSLTNVDTESPAGEGLVTRWVPTVESPAPAQVAGNNAQPLIPEVPRPDLSNNSKVLLVDCTTLDRAFVRPSDSASQRQYDTVLQDVLLYASTATPVKEPPQKGQVVIGKFTDGFHYRALCKRTNVKQNKYLLEYIEFGNVEVTQLENIYPCPPNLDLSSLPAQPSLVTLKCAYSGPMSEPAVNYLNKLKDDAVELTLTIPTGDKTAPSGSPVCLTVVKTNESVNRKLEEMCTPEWKKMEEKGGDVVDTKPLMYGDLEYLELPADGCKLEILDVSAIVDGSVSACQQGCHQLGRLAEQMAAYCNSEIGKEPYLPKFEELCIARFPPYPDWFRAVLLEQTPGSASARVCYVDYGNVEEVPVEMLRKMLPEFARGRPALASHLEIKDFPPNPTPEQLALAIRHMKINDEGRGELVVTKCEKQEGGLYVVHAPELIKAMRG